MERYATHPRPERLRAARGQVRGHSGVNECNGDLTPTIAVPDILDGDNRRQRSKAFMRLAAKGFLGILLFGSCATALRAQTIQIKLVNGKTGLLWRMPVWVHG